MEFSVTVWRRQHLVRPGAHADFGEVGPTSKLGGVGQKLYRPGYVALVRAASVCSK